MYTIKIRYVVVQGKIDYMVIKYCFTTHYHQQQCPYCLFGTIKFLPRGHSLESHKTTEDFFKKPYRFKNYRINLAIEK